MTALLALALAAAPACPAALAAAGAPDDALAARAAALVDALDEADAGPTGGVRAVAAALAAAEPGRARAAAAASFRGALARHCALAAAPPLPPASAQDRAALAEVLARPELSPVRLDPWAIRRALARFWDWIVELLGTSEAERYASLGRALFLGAAAAAVVLGVAAVRRRREGGSRGARGEDGDPARAGGSAPGASAARADEALRRGEPREAIRLALLAAIGALERAGRVPRGRALTNEELVTLVASRRAEPGPARVQVDARDLDEHLDEDEDEADAPPISHDLALLARAFDRAIYGGLPATLDDARGAIERARRVVAAAGGTP